jgi:uncharacterized protein (DUF3084 family)
MQSNAKLILIILVVAIVALVIAIFWVHDKGKKDLGQAQRDLTDLKVEVDVLNTNLRTKKEELQQKEEAEAALKTRLEQAARDKQAVEQQLAAATNDLFKASAKLENVNKTVTALTTDKKNLQGQVSDLNSKLASLDQKITTLEDELDRGEKNRELLLRELAAVRLDKANLEKKFNDIGAVRDQYRVLRHDEILENRRRWIAQGYDGFYVKSGVYEAPKPYTSKPSDYDIKAEIRLSADTNRPAHSISDKPGR